MRQDASQELPPTSLKVGAELPSADQRLSGMLLSVSYSHAYAACVAVVCGGSVSPCRSEAYSLPPPGASPEESQKSRNPMARLNSWLLVGEHRVLRLGEHQPRSQRRRLLQRRDGVRLGVEGRADTSACPDGPGSMRRD
jgi:hypothetical protein